MLTRYLCACGLQQENPAADLTPARDAHLNGWDCLDDAGNATHFPGCAGPILEEVRA